MRVLKEVVSVGVDIEDLNVNEDRSEPGVENEQTK